MPRDTLDARRRRIWVLLSTHKRIAEKIASELKLSPKEAEPLEKGSIRPDYWKDYPHHYGKERHIRQHIVEARRLFLNDEKLESLFNLGLAFHYIQDRWVTVPGSSMNHGWWEDQIDDAPFVDDIVEMVKDFDLTHLYRGPQSVHARDDEKLYLQINEQLLEFQRLCRSNFEGRDGWFAESATLNIATLERPTLGTPIFDLNFAYRVSVMVAISVYGPKTSSTLQQKLERTKNEFEVKLKNAEEALAAKLVELDNRRTELKQKRDLVNRLKGLVCNFNIWINRRRYEKRSHLLQVQEAYYREVERESGRFANWYDVAIPELDIEQVERLLI